MVSVDTKDSQVPGDMGRAAQIVAFNGAQPAAGVEFSYTVPAGTLLKILSVRTRLTTSAVVANRGPSIAISDNNNVTVFTFNSGSTVSASTTGTVQYFAGLGANVGVNFSIPEIWLPGGWKIHSSTALIDAADQYEAPVFSGIRYQ